MDKKCLLQCLSRLMVEERNLMSPKCHLSTTRGGGGGENRIMLCAARIFYAACSTKHHPLKSKEYNRRFLYFSLNSFQSAEEGWFFTNYVVVSDPYFL